MTLWLFLTWILEYWERLQRVFMKTVPKFKNSWQQTWVSKISESVSTLSRTTEFTVKHFFFLVPYYNESCGVSQAGLKWSHKSQSFFWTVSHLNFPTGAYYTENHCRWWRSSVIARDLLSTFASILFQLPTILFMLCCRCATLQSFDKATGKPLIARCNGPIRAREVCHKWLVTNALISPPRKHHSWGE